MNQKELIPKLRFPEFTNAWEHNTLEDLANYDSSNISLSALEDYDGEELYPIYDANSICKYIDTFKQGKGYISIIKDGAGAGRLHLCSGKSSVIGTMGYIKNNEDVDLKFLYHYATTINFTKYISGSTIPHIYFKDYKNEKISTPSTSEQEKIGNFLQHIDKTITLQQRKCSELLQKRKVLLRQMFPLAKEDAPELRFLECNSAWKEMEINDVANRYDNLRVPITASKRIYGTTPYYGANGIQDYVEGYTHEGEFILIAEDGANDFRDYPVQYVTGKVWVNNHAHVLQAKQSVSDNKFLMNAIKNTNIEPFLVGGSRAKLNAAVLMKIKIKVPSLNEQIKIGSLLDDVDSTIVLNQRKLKLLEKRKKALLQQMFV